MKERQREYETVYLLRPDADADDRTDIEERLKDAVDESGGHVLTFDDWGNRELAYTVKDETDGRKFEQARYQYFRFLSPADEVDAVERQLKLVESTLKYLTVKLDDDLIPDERLEQAAVPEDGDRIPYEEDVQ
jgi:small subunit ribosomal protein S6